jgi:hypothetical protein
VTRTPTKPPTDRAMWRRLLSRAHPDAGGDHELFIWTGNLKNFVCSGLPSEAPTPIRPEPTRGTEPERVPFPPGTDFEALTRRAISTAEDEPPPYSYVLRLLRDCGPLPGFEDKQGRGATYKQLAAVAHIAGMSKAERVRWYRIAESVPLADRHAGHLLGKLKRRAA